MDASQEQDQRRACVPHQPLSETNKQCIDLRKRNYISGQHTGLELQTTSGVKAESIEAIQKPRISAMDHLSDIASLGSSPPHISRILQKRSTLA